MSTKPSNVRRWDDRVGSVRQRRVGWHHSRIKWIRLACQRHLDDLRDGHDRGLWFDPDAANAFVAFLNDSSRTQRADGQGNRFTFCPGNNLPWPPFSVGNETTDRVVSRPRTSKSVAKRKTQLMAGIGLASDFDGEAAAESCVCRPNT